MMTLCEDLGKNSKWMVNDLSLKSKWMAVGPFSCYELFVGHKSWVSFELEEIDTDDGIVTAAQEDPDYHHGSVVMIYKTDTSVPEGNLVQFIDCMVESAPLNQAVEFFEESIISSLEDSDHDDAISLKERIENQIDIIHSEESKENEKKEAVKELWTIWFDKDLIRGPIAITRWIRQETNANIQSLESALERKIKAMMGSDFKWRNGTLGTVNILSTPLLGLHYDDARDSPLPDHMPGGFWSCESPKRLIRQSKDFGPSIKVIRQQKFKPEERKDGEFNKDHYTVDFLLRYNGKHYFIDCKLGQAIERGVDKHIQMILRHPDIFGYALHNGWNYYWGCDEYLKLDAQQGLLHKLKDFEKKITKQKKNIGKLKKFKKRVENDAESEQNESDTEDDDMDVDKDKDKKTKRNKNKGKSKGNKKKNDQKERR